MKLYHGSRGSLVTILDATLRLRPHPPCDRLVVARRTTLSDLAPPHEIRDALPADPASFHAHGELGRPGEIEVVLRFQGAPAAVDLLCKQAREQLGELAEVQDVPPPGPGARPPVL